MSGILVTGAAGFIGRSVVTALLDRGVEVHGLARDVEGRGLDPRARWHGGDLHDRGRMREILGDVRCEGLIHLAWTTRHGEYWSSLENLEWVAASLQLFRDFAASGGKRIVVAGSSAEYEWHGTTEPFDEAKTPLRPASLYGTCKDSLRRMLEAWAGDAGISWGWGRIFNVYGPYESPGRLVPRLIRALQAGEEVPFDDGASVGDFMHVADAGKAFAALYASSFCGPVNIATGEPTRIRHLAEEIARRIGGNGRVRFGDRAGPAATCVVGSARRVREVIQWAPQLKLEEGLQDACGWWRERTTGLPPR